mmetsp:Transcript_34958/g.100354  ORF Transcript_34958/g.100354 Transcript_34958/m.100354 type:complete len:249 (-) Transcript_34958:62-808(-)
MASTISRRRLTPTLRARRAGVFGLASTATSLALAMPRSSSGLVKRSLPSKSKYLNHALGLSCSLGGFPRWFSTLSSSRWSLSHASMPPGLRNSASVRTVSLSSRTEHTPKKEAPVSKRCGGGAAPAHQAGQSSCVSLGAKAIALIGKSAQRAPRATRSVSSRREASCTMEVSYAPPFTRSSGTQASLKKFLGSSVGSARREAEEKGARQRGHTGPGGCGSRPSRRLRQMRSRSAASSCTCSAQSKQQK